MTSRRIVQNFEHFQPRLSRHADFPKILRKFRFRSMRLSISKILELIAVRYPIGAYFRNGYRNRPFRRLCHGIDGLYIQENFPYYPLSVRCPRRFPSFSSSALPIATRFLGGYVVCFSAFQLCKILNISSPRRSGIATRTASAIATRSLDLPATVMFHVPPISVPRVNEVIVNRAGLSGLSCVGLSRGYCLDGIKSGYRRQVGRKKPSSLLTGFVKHKWALSSLKNNRVQPALCREIRQIRRSKM